MHVDLCAEDVVQDALLKLFTMRSRLDDYHSPAALARTVVRHLSLNAIRDRKSVAAIDMARMTADEEAPDEGELAGRRGVGRTACPHAGYNGQPARFAADDNAHEACRRYGGGADRAGGGVFPRGGICGVEPRTPGDSRTVQNRVEV